MEGCNLWASFSPSTGCSRWLLVPDPGFTRFLPVKKGSFFFSLSPSAFWGFLLSSFVTSASVFLKFLFFESLLEAVLDVTPAPHWWKRPGYSLIMLQ